MSNTDYLKCSCQKCGGYIEFPSSGAEELVDCPHCGAQTKLVSTSEKSPAQFGRKFAIIAGSILVVLILATAGVIFCRPKTQMSEKPVVSAPSSPPLDMTNAVIPKTYIELNDFKIGKITLKKIEGSGLIYAVGIVKNDTARQRFGVKIELDLLDTQDNKIGSASDYIAVLEPRKEWHFDALLTEPKAVNAKLAHIEEQK